MLYAIVLSNIIVLALGLFTALTFLVIPAEEAPVDELVSYREQNKCEVHNKHEDPVEAIEEANAGIHRRLRARFIARCARAVTHTSVVGEVSARRGPLIAGVR
jgi:hypothetical protein